MLLPNKLSQISALILEQHRFFDSKEEILQLFNNTDQYWKNHFSEILGDFTTWEYNLRPPTLENGVQAMQEVLEYLAGPDWRHQINLFNLYELLDSITDSYWNGDVDIPDSDKEILQDRESYMIFKALFGNIGDNPPPQQTINPAQYNFLMRKIQSKINGTWNDEIFPDNTEDTYD